MTSAFFSQFLPPLSLLSAYNQLLFDPPPPPPPPPLSWDQFYRSIIFLSIAHLFRHEYHLFGQIKKKMIFFISKNGQPLNFSKLTSAFPSTLVQQATNHQERTVHGVDVRKSLPNASMILNSFVNDNPCFSYCVEKPYQSTALGQTYPDTVQCHRWIFISCIGWLSERSLLHAISIWRDFRKPLAWWWNWETWTSTSHFSQCKSASKCTSMWPTGQ